MTETTGEALERIHKDTAPALGYLSLTISRRSVRPAQLRSWADTLERGARELRALATTLENKR